MSNDITFPQVFDATMLRAAKGCQRKFYWEFIRHRVPEGTNPDLNAGGAYAKAHERFRFRYYRDGWSLDDSVAEAFIALTLHFGEDDPPVENPKQWDRMVEALVAYYYEAYPPDFDDHQPHMIGSEPCVEFSFAEPIEHVLHPETGEPLLYAGTFDMLSEHRTRTLYVFDDKTTKQMGPKWSQQWRLRSQFIGYVWGARQFGYDVKGAWVRGCALKKRSIEFAEAPIQIPQWMIEQWYWDTVHQLHALIQAWNWGHYIKDFDEECSKYGGCSYLPLCEIPDEQAEDFIDDYAIKQWNPVATEGDEE